MDVDKEFHEDKDLSHYRPEGQYLGFSVASLPQQHRDLGEGEAGAYRANEAFRLVNKSTGFELDNIENLPTIYYISRCIVKHGAKGQIHDH